MTTQKMEKKSLIGKLFQFIKWELHDIPGKNFLGKLPSLERI